MQRYLKPAFTLGVLAITVVVWLNIDLMSNKNQPVIKPEQQTNTQVTPIKNNAEEEKVAATQPANSQQNETHFSAKTSPFIVKPVAIFSATEAGMIVKAAFFNLDSMEQGAQHKIDFLIAELKKNPEGAIEEISLALSRLPTDSMNGDAKRKLTFLLGEINSAKAIPVLVGIVEETNGVAMTAGLERQTAINDQMMALTAIYQSSQSDPVAGQQVFLNLLQHKADYPATSRKDAIWYYLQLSTNPAQDEATLKPYLAENEYGLMHREFDSLAEVSKQLKEADKK